MRRLRVDQKENDQGEFWYTVDRGNASTMLTSEMYPTRSNAIRAARGFINAVGPVPVTFSYWKGPRTGPGKFQYIVERIR